MEHGETEQLDYPAIWGRQKNLQTAPQNSLAIDNTKSKKRNGIISTLAALVIAVAAIFGIC